MLYIPFVILENTEAANELLNKKNKCLFLNGGHSLTFIENAEQYLSLMAGKQPIYKSLYDFSESEVAQYSENAIHFEAYQLDYVRAYKEITEGNTVLFSVNKTGRKFQTITEADQLVLAISENTAIYKVQL